MKQFENKVLFIVGGEMLRLVKELIEKSGNKCGKDFDLLEERFLYYDYSTESFNISWRAYFDEEITLEQFKELLK